MNFNGLLTNEGLDPKQVLVFRHRPHEPQLNRVLPWLAAEKPDIFNAYQQTQPPRLEAVMKKMSGTGYVASFIGQTPGKAVFAGLYAIGKSKALNFQQYWRIPAHEELRTLGMTGFTQDPSRQSTLWFDLSLSGIYGHWKGRLVIKWPPPERSWWRRAHHNDMPILAILEDSALDKQMPTWDAIDLSWPELLILPTSWKSALSQWRAIYYIFDSSDGKGYVGSASGQNNLLGRWQNYAVQSDGGNRLLRKRDPRNFHFSILQRLSPDMERRDVVQIENSWKVRLHTRDPYGLNDN